MLTNRGSIYSTVCFPGRFILIESVKRSQCLFCQLSIPNNLELLLALEVDDVIENKITSIPLVLAPYDYKVKPFQVKHTLVVLDFVDTYERLDRKFGHLKPFNTFFQLKLFIFAILICLVFNHIEKG